MVERVAIEQILLSVIQFYLAIGLNMKIVKWGVGS
jgi:hypothetical protein